MPEKYEFPFEVVDATGNKYTVDAYRTYVPQRNMVNLDAPDEPGTWRFETTIKAQTFHVSPIEKGRFVIVGPEIEVTLTDLDLMSIFDNV